MNPETYVSDIQLAERYGLQARETIWKWARKNKFPQPVKLSPGCTRWRMSDVIAWEATR